MRLIDADALERQLNTQYDFLCKQYGGYDHYTTGYGDALCTVEDTPTVEDAVVVVRCKDCRHYDEHTDKWGTWQYCNLTDRIISEKNSFCSFGERKSDNEG